MQTYAGLPVPGDVMLRLPALRSTARYIIVIEKDGVFERLVEDGFHRRVPCILVCCSL
jgi:DNA topoisomerase VI subunit A